MVLGMDSPFPRPSAVVDSTVPHALETPPDAALPPPLEPSGEKSPGKFTIRDSVTEVIDQFQVVLAGQMKPWLTTGFRQLDELTTGLKPGELFVIGGRPGMGKTSLMLTIVEHICIEQKAPTLIFSGKTSAFEITKRMVFSRAKFPLHQYHPRYTPRKYELINIQRAASDIAHAELFMDDEAGLSIEVLRERAIRYKEEKNIRLLVIDDLHSLKSDSKRAARSRKCEAAAVAAGIKALARELGIPVLVLAILKHRPAPRVEDELRGIPSLADFPDSGAIAQDADIVALLHLKSYGAEDAEEKEAYEGLAELIVAKNLNGKTGWVPLIFIGDLMRFEYNPVEEEQIREAWESHREDEMDEEDPSEP
jgi:replicative DNA helicase